MEHPLYSQHFLEYFFSDYQRQNVLLVLLYLVLTGGVFALFWIYYHNRKLEQIDNDAPNSKRGAVILFFIPVFLTLVFFFIKTIFLPDFLGIRILEVILWSVVILLTLKYFYEFCVSFAKFTMTTPLAWYFFLYLGYSSFILALFEFYYGLFGLFFLFVGIMAMQEIVNVICYKVNSRKEKNRFNYMKKSNSAQYPLYFK